ncbi:MULTISPECIES: UbiA family prenyltransferase [Streptomyces]|uniref:UbiA family prenyltransferase n=1 Tax=Streptomyces ramulosus TaxID=47762 RepID=A0ABW1FDE6_9ACTN
MHAEPAAFRTAPFGAYVRLAKADSLDLFLLPILVGWSALPAGHRLAAGSVLVVALITLGTAGVFAAAVALDDVRGHRDGSDAANYGAAHGLRELSRKPLLGGELTGPQALRFAYAAWGAGVFLWCLAVAAAAQRPGWVVLLVVVLLAAAPQYSWGLRLSHRGMGETLMAYFSVVLPVAVLTLAAGGRPTSVPLLQALLVGVWHVLIDGFANTADVFGDRAVGRRTFATWASPARNRAFLAALITAELLLTAAVIGLSPAPGWFAVALLPVVVLRFRQVHEYGRSGDAAAASRRCWHIHRLGAWALTVANCAATTLL